MSIPNQRPDLARISASSPADPTGVPVFGSIVDHPALPVLYEDADLKLTRLPGDGDHCVITFIGVGLGLGGIDQQSEEFRKLGPTWGAQIFVFDKRRTWGNGIDMNRIEALTAPHRAGRTTVCIGLSMGGFLAIHASTLLGARCCIAFAPQFSMHPDIVPFESRWAQYAQQISVWRYPSLEGRFGPRCDYYAFFPECPDDRAHLALFPTLPNLTCFVVNDPEHNVAATLKRQGLLYPTIAACISGLSAPEMPFVSSWVRGYLTTSLQPVHPRV